MPKQHRYALKQDLTTAIGELGKAQDKLYQVGEQFAEPHPEMAEQLAMMWSAIDMVRETVIKFRDSF